MYIQGSHHFWDVTYERAFTEHAVTCVSPNVLILFPLFLFHPRGGELVIPLLVEDPLATLLLLLVHLPLHSSPLPSAPPHHYWDHQRLLSMTSEAGLPACRTKAAHGCGWWWLGDIWVWLRETFWLNLPPTDDEDFYTTFSLVTDKSLSTSIFEGVATKHMRPSGNPRTLDLPKPPKLVGLLPHLCPLSWSVHSFLLVWDGAQIASWQNE